MSIINGHINFLLNIGSLMQKTELCKTKDKFTMNCILKKIESYKKILYLKLLVLLILNLACYFLFFHNISINDIYKIIFKKQSEVKNEFSVEFKHILNKINVYKFERGDLIIDFEQNHALSKTKYKILNKIIMTDNLYSGSFTKLGENQKFVHLICKEINSHQWLYNIFLIVDENNNLIKQYGPYKNLENRLDSLIVKDIDKDGYSEIVFDYRILNVKIRPKYLLIYYKTMDDKIFSRLLDYSYIKADFGGIKVKSTYNIINNIITCYTTINIFKLNWLGAAINNRNFKKKDVYKIINGKVTHIYGNIENFEDYLNKLWTTYFNIK